MARAERSGRFRRWRLPTLASRAYHALFMAGPLAFLLWRAPGISYYLDENHGWVLAGAQQVLFGKFPCADLLCAYGPLTFLISALGLWIHDSLIAETLICAVGFATAIFLVHLICHEHISSMAGVLAPVIALGLVPMFRLFRWPQWLFPMLALYCLHAFERSSDREKKKLWLVLSGAVAGIAWLFRVDFGIVALTFFVICNLVQSTGLTRAVALDLLLIMSGFLLPLLLFGLVLTLHGGSVIDYLDVSRRYAYQLYEVPRRSFNGIGIQVPRLHLSMPFSMEAGTALAHMLIPFASIACVVVGTLMLRDDRERREEGVFAIAVGAMGIGVFPAAYYYPNLTHVLFVAPTSLVAFCLAGSLAWREAMRFQHLSRWPAILLRSIVAVYLGLGCVVLWDIRDVTRVPYSIVSNPVPRYRELARGIESAPDQPVVSLIAEIRRIAGPDDSVLLLPDSLDSHILFFAHRRHSAVDIIVNPSAVDDPKLKRANYESIMKDPPKVVIVHRAFFTRPDRFMAHQPDLYSYVLQRYPQVAYEGAGYRLLIR